jgi:hypothetical protein
MTPTQPPDDPKSSRKYILTKAWLGINSAVMAGAGALTAIGKLSPDFATMATAFFVASAGVIASYSVANAYESGEQSKAGFNTQGGGT